MSIAITRRWAEEVWWHSNAGAKIDNMQNLSGVLSVRTAAVHTIAVSII